MTLPSRGKQRRWLALGMTITVCFHSVVLAAERGANACNRGSVVIMRHCVRSPSAKFKVDSPYSTSPADYSSHDRWPDFGVPSEECTASGVDLVEGQGKYLASTIPPGEVRIVSDSVHRDIVTARALAKGLKRGGRKVHRIEIQPTYFDAVRAGVCSNLPPAIAKSAVEMRWKQSPKPSDMDDLVGLVQKVLGNPATERGGARLADMPTYLKESDGSISFSGGLMVIQGMAEYFLLEYCAGLELGWGKLSTSDMFRFLKIHDWYFSIAHGPPDVVRRKKSNMLNQLVNILAAKCDSNLASPYESVSTTFFVGHDTDLTELAAMLGMSWSPSQPYSVNTTLPGSALQFTLSGHGRELLVDYSSPSYHQEHRADWAKMWTTPVTFQSTNGTVSFDQFRMLASESISKDCVAK